MKNISSKDTMYYQEENEDVSAYTCIFYFSFVSPRVVRSVIILIVFQDMGSDCTSSWSLLIFLLFRVCIMFQFSVGRPPEALFQSLLYL